jgi:hypothetical protein
MFYVPDRNNQKPNSPPAGALVGLRLVAEGLGAGVGPSGPASKVIAAGAPVVSSSPLFQSKAYEK